MSTRISTIIPTYKQDELCILHALEAQRGSLPPDEIIIVNDGGPDICAKLMAQDWKTTVILAQLQLDVLWNITGAKNTGIWLSSGDILAIEDCDHIPGPRTYETATALLAGTFFDGKRCVAVKPLRIKHKGVAEFAQNREGYAKTFPGSGTVIASAFAVKAVCGFAEHMAGHYGGDDIDFRRRLAAQGYTEHPADMADRYHVIQRGVAFAALSQAQRQGGTGICRVPFTVTRIN